MPYKDPAKHLEWNRNWHRRKKAEENKRSADWRAANPGKAMASRASWRKRNPERQKELAEDRKVREALAALHQAQPKPPKPANLALAALALMMAREVLQARARGYSGNINPGRI